MGAAWFEGIRVAWGESLMLEGECVGSRPRRGEEGHGGGGVLVA